MEKIKRLFWPFVELCLMWGVLLWVGFYTFTYFVNKPYIGFAANQSKTITSLTMPAEKMNGLQLGDTLRRVDAVTAADLENDLRIGYFNDLKAGDQVEIVVERQGQLKTIPYTIPGINAGEIFNRLNSQWFIPYIFWLAGTVTFLFLRPRQKQRLLLALFCYLTAIWLGTSNSSGDHFMNTALVLRSMVWLSIPVYLHMHWMFPTPLRRLPIWTWTVLYVLCAAMALMAWFQWLPQNAYMMGFIFAIVGSLILLVVHLITQPAERSSLQGLVIALGMVLLPVITVLVVQVLDIQFNYPGIVVLGLAALPGFYFFTLYRRQLTHARSQQANNLVRVYLVAIFSGLLFCLGVGLLAQTPMIYEVMYSLSILAVVILLVTAMVSFAPFVVLPALANEKITLGLGEGKLSFSANRVASGLVFLSLEALLILMLVFFIQQLNLPGSSIINIVIAILLSELITLFAYQPFRRFFDRVVLGVSIEPEMLVKTYSARITTSLELTALQNLLLEEVLPSLLIRQFIHIKLQNGVLETLFSLRVTPEMLASLKDPAQLSRAVGNYLAAENHTTLPAWVRLVIPLSVANEVQGYWLLGQRDPDDRYSQDDMTMLKMLADQTALALVNIDQAEALQAFYFADIDRNEVERIHLAAELHDDVLNQLAILSTNLQDTSSVILAAYDQAVFRIREIINGLRPAMLNYGLFSALEELVDDLNDRLVDGPQIVLDLQRSPSRYDERVELYLFRIVQQACNNAVQHAECKTIKIMGDLGEAGVKLVVSDDGKGFSSENRFDLQALLAQKHFGLAGMFERAALIGSKLQIDSQPGRGCQVNLSWQKNQESARPSALSSRIIP